MTNENEYVSGNDDSDDNVAALRRGDLIAWRTSADGTVWYRRRIQTEAVAPEIMAVEGDDDAGYDPPATLDDFERSQLREWADDLRRRASEGFDDATDE